VCCVLVLLSACGSTILVEDDDGADGGAPSGSGASVPSGGAPPNGPGQGGAPPNGPAGPGGAPPSGPSGPGGAPPNGPGPGPGPGGGSPGSCYLEDGALVYEPFQVLTAQNLCTLEQVDQLIAACLDFNATEASCDGFLEMEPECANCLVASFDEPGILPAAASVFDFVFPSIYACEAVVQGKPGCAQEVSDFVLCSYTACSECDLADPSFTDCVDFASTQGICGAQLGVSDFCLSVLDAQSATCTGADFIETFRNIGQLFCGPP
jgi:hypothetical protein